MGSQGPISVGPRWLRDSFVESDSMSAHILDGDAQWLPNCSEIFAAVASLLACLLA